MYENPVLFPQTSNRESWNQIVQIFDDDTGDLIALTDDDNNPLYAITLEISAAGPSHGFGGYGIAPGPYYDSGGEPVIEATLANYITILDTGTIQIAIPKSVMTSLRRTRTYDVFLTIDPNGEDDGRQLLIGKLPVLFGGVNT